MAKFPQFYYQPEIDQYKKGGYITPGENVTYFDPSLSGIIVPTRRFPFEYELLKKLRLPLDALPEEEFLTRDGRIQFVLESDRRVIEDGEPVVEYVKWTEEQEDVINAVWHLIDDRCKVR